MLFHAPDLSYCVFVNPLNSSTSEVMPKPPNTVISYILQHSNVDSNTNDNIRLSDIDPEMPPLASVGSNPMTSFSNPMHDIKGSDVEEGSDAEDHDDEDD